eukprot:GHVN01091747.1.p1 GENE.GHVN01091747.1~~GHVN01091747.1.p1  ORF type:complete len:295 (+),score=51.06 GHVN01091747.1:30-887(+)
MDHLTQLHDLFHLGCYKSVLEYQTSPLNDLSQAELDMLRLRSSLALGDLKSTDCDLLLNSTSSSPGVKAVALAAKCMTAQPSELTAHVNAIRKLNTVTSGVDSTVRCMLACCLAVESEVNEVSESLVEGISVLDDGGPLENQCLRAQLCIMADRPDLAGNIQRTMVTEFQTEDAPMIRLVTAWRNIMEGQFQESYLTFGDLETDIVSQDVSEVSHTIVNGKAVANMHRRQWEEALEELEGVRKEVKELATCGVNDVGGAEAVTLANLVCVNRNMGKHEIADSLYE